MRTDSDRHEDSQTPPAQRLIGSVYSRLEQQADPQIARLRYENLLRKQGRQGTAATPLRLGFRVAIFCTLLLFAAGWAGRIPVEGWEDGQEISIILPQNYRPSQYVHYVALCANHAKDLADAGGHSLVVDCHELANGNHALQLNVLGINYTDANDWVRGVLETTPDFSQATYSVTQPLASYRVTVSEMLAYELAGSRDIVERNVLKAWYTEGRKPTGNAYIYLIAHPDAYARRVSMVRR